VSQRKRKFKVNNKSRNKTNNNIAKEVDKEKVLDQLDNLTAGAKKRKDSVNATTSSTKNYYILGGVAITVIVIGLIAFSPLGGPAGIIGNDNGLELATYTNTCIKATDNIDIHNHAQLTILYNGENKPIPADTGLTSSCHSPIHTHAGEAAGRLHVESSSKYELPPATLGDFFDIWEKPLTESRVWDYTGTVNMTANGFPVSPPFRELVLVEGHDIIIEVTSS
jgi:hypothetical protein